jgi:hypothetical protein
MSKNPELTALKHYTGWMPRFIHDLPLLALAVGVILLIALDMDSIAALGLAADTTAKVRIYRDRAANRSKQYTVTIDGVDKTTARYWFLTHNAGESAAHTFFTFVGTVIHAPGRH